MIRPVRRRIAFWTGVVLLSWSALLWLIVVAIALEEPEELSDLIIAASVMTGAGLWTLLVGRGMPLPGGPRRRQNLKKRPVSRRRTTDESTLIEEEKRRIKEELDGYDRVIAAHEEAKDSTSLVEPASALVGKGRLLARSDRPTEALSEYEKVLTRWGESTHPELQPIIATALVGKAIALSDLGRNKESLAVAEEVITRFGNRFESEFDESVAGALGVQGQSLLALGRIDEAFQALDLVLARYGDACDPSLQKVVAGALQFKAFALHERERGDEGIALLDEIVARFRNASEADLRVAAALALGAKGAAIGEQGRPAEALAAYDDSFELASTGTGLDSLVTAGMAQVRRSMALAELGRWSEAMSGFNEAIRRFDGLGEPELDSLVAQAWLNKGQVRAAMGRWKKASATWSGLIDHFGDTSDPEVFESVVTAMISRAGVLLEAGRWKKALKLSAEASDLILKDQDAELLEAVPLASGFMDWTSRSNQAAARGIMGLVMSFHGFPTGGMLLMTFEEFARSVPEYEPFVHEVQMLESDELLEKPMSDSPQQSMPRVKGRHMKPDVPREAKGSGNEDSPGRTTRVARDERLPRSLERLSSKALKLFETGRYEEARALYARLVAESVAALGPDHELTLHARASLANTYGDTPEQGIVLLEELLGDMRRVFDAEDERLFPVRADLAAMYGISGDHAKANALAKTLLRDVERISGSEDPQARAASETMFVSDLELTRAAAKPAYRELASLMDLSVEGLPQEPGPPDWQQDLAVALSQLEESRSFRSRCIGRFNGPESGTIEWSVDYVRPDRFHVIQIALEQAVAGELYDEWITIGGDHYQNTGIWIKETVPDRFQFEFGLNPLLRGDGYGQLARGSQSDAVFQVESPEGEYLLVSYASAPPDLRGLIEFTVVEAKTTLWVDLGRMILARADCEIRGHQGQAEIQARFIHGFTSYGEDMAIPEPPEGYFLDARTQS